MDSSDAVGHPTPNTVAELASRRRAATRIDCPTPRKKVYRSRAAAMKKRLVIKNKPAHRDYSLEPYLCSCGEHWHLTTRKEGHQ